MKAAVLVAILLVLTTLTSSQHFHAAHQRWRRLITPSNGEMSHSDNDAELASHEHSVPHSSFGSDACKIPETLSEGDASLECITLPGDTIVCTHTCGFGYTHEEGLVKEMTCLPGEGKWKPEFESCKPFVDCSLTLLGGARSKCTRKDFTEGTSCHIICSVSDGINPPTETTSQCTINGAWVPELPWCAKRGGLRLASPPYGRKVITF